MNIVLEESVDILQEVVLVGYGVQKKALVTGASVNVKGEEIAALNTSTAMAALQGVAAGVSITQNNGSPGAGTRVTIRGLGPCRPQKCISAISALASSPSVRWIAPNTSATRASLPSPTSYSSLMRSAHGPRKLSAGCRRTCVSAGRFRSIGHRPRLTREA